MGGRMKKNTKNEWEKEWRKIPRMSEGVKNKNTKKDLAEEWRRIRRISVGRNEQAYEESCENEWRIRIQIESGEEGWRIRKIWERKNEDEYGEWLWRGEWRRTRRISEKKEWRKLRRMGEGARKKNTKNYWEEEWKRTKGIEWEEMKNTRNWGRWGIKKKTKISVFERMKTNANNQVKWKWRRRIESDEEKVKRWTRMKAMKNKTLAVRLLGIKNYK